MHLHFLGCWLGETPQGRTLVTSMIIMGNLSENRLRLAQGIIEHVAAFALSIENTQREKKKKRRKA